MYKLHSRCRACGYETLSEVLDLGVQPLANDFQDVAGDHAGFAPLKVLFCPRCSLGQLSVVVDPEILYSNYSYVTGTSPSMKAHFAELWSAIQSESAAKSVVEIGSNTGDFLEYSQKHGAKQVLGIDPAMNLCSVAEAKGIRTWPCLFDAQIADRVRHWFASLDVVVARHVFCHVDDWKEFMVAMQQMGHSETLYVLEMPYAPDTLKINSWDQVYHEHLSYFTLRAMFELLRETNLHVHGTVKYVIHGGAVVIMLRRNDSKKPPHPPALDNVTEQDWLGFSERAKTQQIALKRTIESLLHQGKTVAGFGASAKSTVWINACGLTRKHLMFVCDSTPQKQSKLIPGSNIPVCDEGELMRKLPDYTVCFAWNFLSDILASQETYTDTGGKFIVPVPELRIIPFQEIDLPPVPNHEPKPTTP